MRAEEEDTGSLFEEMAHSGNFYSTSEAVLDTEPVTLNDLLDRGWKLFEDVDKTTEATGSNSVQVKVKRGIIALEEASRMVAQLDLFSRNEELEELATIDMKYLMLPALLGALTLKLTNRDKRLELIQTARRYFYDFLRLCKDYKVTDFVLSKSTTDNSAHEEDAYSGRSTVKPTSSAGQSNLVAMAAQRQAKINRYKQKMEAENTLLEIKTALENGDAADEVLRDFYLLSLKKWVNISMDEIDTIDQEVEILQSRQRYTGAPLQVQSPPRPSIKPFILTKDTVQAKVFGAGYPSLPTMTVDDWYEQHRKHGALPDQGIASRVAVEEDIDSKDHEEENKESEVENDDEALQKARNWDDWKDAHRRGYGNRKNMG